MLTIAAIIVLKVAIASLYFILCKPVWIGITKLNSKTHEESEISELSYIQRVLFYLWLCLGCNIIVFTIFYSS